MDQDDEALEELLRTASAAPPSERIQFRDDIAAFGSAAVPVLAPWLRDARLGTFAVRVLEEIGRRPDGRADAISALAEARTTAASESTRFDAAQSLANLKAGRDELVYGRFAVGRDAVTEGDARGVVGGFRISQPGPLLSPGSMLRGSRVERRLCLSTNSSTQSRS